MAGACGLALLVAEAFLRGELCRRAGEEEFARVAERFRANPLSVRPKRQPPLTGISAVRRARGGEGINAQGFRGPGVSPTKPADTLRVVCLGGSSVYGTANSNVQNTWPARLQAVLSATRPVEVLNGGVPGFQAMQSVGRFETVFAPLHCDVAILCNLFNDIITSRTERLGLLGGDRAVDPLEGWMPQLLSHSALGMLMLSSSLDVGGVWDDDGDPSSADGTSFLRPVPPTIQEHEKLRERTLDAHELDVRRPGSGLDRCFYPQGQVRQLAAILAHGSRRDRLKDVRIPTLVIHGIDDPLVPVEGGKDTAAHIEGAELMLVEGMGHDNPRQVWPRAVEAITALTRRAARAEAELKAVPAAS